jgi:hypothetical protein
MFTERITRSDAFLDMPTSTQALYFHLLSEADDDGFVSSPKMVMRIVGANPDEIKTLVGKKFLIPFAGGVCVIKHWRMHNQVRKDRYEETKYKKEKQSLFIRGNGSYSTNPDNALPVPSGYFTVENIETMLLATTWQPTVALGEGRVGQVNLAEPSSDELLEDKKNNVSFKNMRRYKGEEGGYEEVAVQTDPDYKPKKKSEKKVSDDIQAVFDLFNNPASALWRMREIERVASQTLFDTYGLEKLKIRVNRIQEEAKKKDPLFPHITTPSQLLDKMPNVERYLNV